MPLWIDINNFFLLPTDTSQAESTNGKNKLKCKKKSPVNNNVTLLQTFFAGLTRNSQTSTGSRILHSGGNGKDFFFKGSWLLLCDFDMY